MPINYNMIKSVLLVPFLAVASGTNSSISQRIEDLQFDSKNNEQCSLWLSRSAIMPSRLGLYAGVDYNAGDFIGKDDGGIHIPLFDTKKNDHGRYLRDGMDIVDDLLLQSSFQIQSFLPGIGSLYLCVQDQDGEPINSVILDRQENVDSVGVHRSTHPAAGSFSYRHGLQFRTVHPIAAGQEIFLSTCPAGEGILRRIQKNKLDDLKSNQEVSHDKTKIPQKWVDEDNKSRAICVDTLTIKPSLNAPGRGAFAKKNLKAGRIVISTPVALLHRSQFEIVEQYYADDNEIRFTDKKKQFQLLLNYAYGNPNSNLLILPYGPGGVHFINHGSVKENMANVRIQWSNSTLSDNSILKLNTLQAMYKEGPYLFMDFVALRDIEEGEEILIDYGNEWSKAWSEHLTNWESKSDGGKYISAADFQQLASDRPFTFQTVSEQKENPYPDNIQTACFYEAFISQDEEGKSTSQEVHWKEENDGCLRPCSIFNRNEIKGENFYDVKVKEMNNAFSPDECVLPEGVDTIFRVPEDKIRLVDIEYTSDEHLLEAFRHEIGIPDDMFPVEWTLERQKDRKPRGDFLVPNLEPLEISHIRWPDGETVTPNAYVLGLPQTMRKQLLSYANRMGITDRFRDLTIRGNPMEPGQEKQITLHGMPWYLQRTSEFWKSTMHWISPADSRSQDNYLQALSAAGFDQILSTIGKQFGFKGLACFHLTFIAVSYCGKGFLHRDISGSAKIANETKFFNVIIPLLLSNETGPELDLASAAYDQGAGKIGRFRYQYDVATMLGDDAVHATSAVDYRDSRQMRMAATVYVADIEKDNIDNIMEYYTQYYPPANRPDLLLAMAGKHWDAQNPNARLPKPNSTFELLRSINQIQELQSRK